METIKNIMNKVGIIDNSELPAKENNLNVLSTTIGTPVDDDENALTAGEFGPMLLQDFQYLDKMAHFDKERVPERVVHANGAGAHGYFEVTTSEAAKYCKSEFLNGVGKKTPVFTRFSTVRGEKGSADTIRDPRGFAIKFYTEEGNFDLVCNNTPVFFIRDPFKFPDFIHSIKPRPDNNLPDQSTFWDFISLHPESIHQVTYMFTERGIPRTFREMNGYSGHSLKLVNIDGKQFWSKWHIKSDLGFVGISDEEGNRLAGDDPRCVARDLWNHLDKGGEATWKVYLQIIPYEEAFTYHINIFDITKIVPHRDYPLIEIGKLVLNRNPTNYFAEVEQSAFSPAHMVPGIEPSPDKMLQGRLFSYTDTHHYRIGVNWKQLPINRPYRSKFGGNYTQDGEMCYSNHGTGFPNYNPNSFDDSLKENKSYSISPFKVDGYASRYMPRLSKISDFHQPGELYRKVLDEDGRNRLVNNIANILKYAKQDVQKRMIDLCSRCDIEYGKKLEMTLDKSIPTISTSSDVFHSKSNF